MTNGSLPEHEIKMLSELLGNITDVSNMTHELVGAEKADPVSTHNYRRHCEARAYKTLQPILSAASRQNAQVEEDLGAFLKASPVLAHQVARWQAQG